MKDKRHTPSVALIASSCLIHSQKHAYLSEKTIEYRITRDVQKLYDWAYQKGISDAMRPDAPRNGWLRFDNKYIPTWLPQDKAHWCDPD